MTSESECDGERAQPLRPKRGAFPTPKCELEKAEPYVPETAEPEPEAPADDAGRPAG